MQNFVNPLNSSLVKMIIFSEFQMQKHQTVKFFDSVGNRLNAFVRDIGGMPPNKGQTFEKNQFFQVPTESFMSSSDRDFEGTKLRSRNLKEIKAPRLEENC